MDGFYTYYNRCWDKILYRYIDFTGERKNEVITKYPLELYEIDTKRVIVKPDASVPSSLFGNALKTHHFESVAEQNEFLKANKHKRKNIFGHANAEYQFIAKEYPDEIKFDYSKINVSFVDIECEFDDTGFPEAAIAAQPITAITLKRHGSQYKYIIFGLHPYTPKPDEHYILCRDESLLLKSFLSVWVQNYPDVVVGFNNIEFDIPYIINRIIKVLGINYAGYLSPFCKDIKRIEDLLPPTVAGLSKKPSYKILGVTIYDYMELYKLYSSNRLESYSLDSISSTELGSQKISYKEEYGNLMILYQKNHQLYIEYNRYDVDLLNQLENKLKYILLGIQQSYIGKVKLGEIKPVKFSDTLLYQYGYAKNIHAPIYSPEPPENVEFTGGYVKEVSPGVYYYIVSLDVTSLYPTIMQNHNVSPETKVRKISDIEISDLIDMKFDTEFLKARNQTMLANGTIFTKSKTGLVPEIINHCFKQRKAKKSEMIKREKADHNDPLVPVLDATQNALKLIMNSFYGAYGNKHFRYFDIDIAEGITITGRVFIQYVIKKTNLYLNELFNTNNIDYVVFSDTDSMGITLLELIKQRGAENLPIKERIQLMDQFTEAHIKPFIDGLCKKFADYFNCTTLSVYDMKREVLADVGIWRKKKNYIMQIYDNEGVKYDPPELKVRGIQIRRSDTPIICRNAMEKCVDVLLNKSESELQGFISDFYNKFKKRNPKEIAFPKGVSDIDKWIDTYYDNHFHSWKKGTPVHVKAAMAYNILRLQHGLQNELPSINNGNKIKFVYLVANNPTPFDVVGFIDDLPKEFGLHKFIDYEMQFDKSFKKPFLTLSTLTGKSIEEEPELEYLW